MPFPLIILFWGVLGISNLGISQSNADPLKKSVFQITKSDSAIKPFVFPKSMIVMQICVPKNRCWLLNPEPGTTTPLDKTVSLYSSLITKVLNDEKPIKKHLIRLDPARIAPSNRGKDSVELYLSKRKLKEIGKRNAADFIFIFVRTINQVPPMSVETQGRIYLVKQNKVLVIPSNNQALDLDTSDLENHLEDVNRKGLQQLAKDARKVIMSHKYEKRRSNY